MKKTSILHQISVLSANRLAAFVGFLFGAIIPVATFHLAHSQVARQKLLWLIVAGGLVVSALSVYEWALQLYACKSRVLNHAKAAGLVVLFEAAMTFAAGWLPYVMLAALVVINGVTFAYKLVCQREAAEKSAKPRTVKRATRKIATA